MNQNPNESSHDEQPQNEQLEEAAPPLSLDDLEKAISESDPDFGKALSELSSIESAHIDESLDLTNTSPTLRDEKIRWEMSTGLWALLKQALPFLPHLTFALRLAKYLIHHHWVNIRVQIIYGLAQLGPRVLEKLKNLGLKIVENVRAPIRKFRLLSNKDRSTLVGLVFFTVFILGLVVWFFKSDLLNRSREPFFLSMEELSSKKFLYDSARDQESFYDSTRVSQNVLSFPKIVTNIRRSQSSDNNPMAAVEFFIEGFSAEVMLELKVREAEMKDHLSSLVANMDYDTLDTPEGKKLLLDRARQSLNSLLAEGQVRRVYIKNFVIKP